MIIGIPKEIMRDERRVAAIPETVKMMVESGHEVLIEKGAGRGCYHTDSEYEACGAKIMESVEELYQKAELILKVKEPLYNKEREKHEIDMMHEGQYLITFIHPASPLNREMVLQMVDKGIIALTLDGIPRISRAQAMDALSSMSTVAGYKGMLMGASAIAKFMPLITSAAGTIRPANVLVIGTGVAGLRAVATAKALGAVVYAADIRPEACEQAKSLGAKIVDLEIPVKLAVEGKYAKRLPDKWLNFEREKLSPVVAKADIIFCSALLLGKTAPVLITEEMVKTMRPGSTIIDISIDQGGNCEITPPGEIKTIHGIIMQGIKNIPGRLPVASTWMFAHNIYHLVEYLFKDGKIALDQKDEIIKGILVCKDKKLLHAGAKEAMGLK